MTVCAQQSVKLHGEAVDNLHSLVDSNVKVELLWLTYQWGLKPLPLSPSPSHLFHLSSSSVPSPLLPLSLSLLLSLSFPPFPPSLPSPLPLLQATYAFLVKFEELQRHTLPLNDLAQQMYPPTGPTHHSLHTCPSRPNELCSAVYRRVQLQ